MNTTNALGPASSSLVVSAPASRLSLWQRYKRLHGLVHIAVEYGAVVTACLILHWL